MKLSLRDYQEAAHDAPLKAWGLAGYADADLATKYAPMIDALGSNPFTAVEGPIRATLMNLATSAGKTIIAAALAITLSAEGGARLMFMADTDDLCDQPMKKFARMEIYAGIEKASKRCRSSDKVVVASAATLTREARLEEFAGRWQPDFIVVDEAHRGSPRNKKITDRFPNAKVLLLTATAFRAGLKDLSDFHDGVCFELGTFDLVNQGYITPIRVLPLQVSIDLKGVHTARKMGETDYNERELAERITPYYESLVESLMEHAPQRQVVSFLPLVNSSRRFVEVCNHHGYPSEHVDGDTPDRHEIYSRFEHRQFRLLSNSSLLTTGWDCPPCDCLLNLRPTKSVSLFRQMVGRIIRVLDNLIDGICDADERRRLIAGSLKPDALILDPLWQTAEMGLVGPSSLIANSAAEAEALTKRDKKGPAGWDLQEEYRRMKEEELAAALEKRAKKQREMLTSGKPIIMTAEEVGAILHQATLFNFEPVSKWESRDLTSQQRTLLQREGIALETIKGRGHAVKIIQHLTDRAQRGLVPLRTAAALLAGNVEHADQLTMDAAGQMLGEAVWPFGPYKGLPLSVAPPRFTQNLSRRWLQQQYPQIANYAASLDS